MRENHTARNAMAFDGNMLYQKRARLALPLLVRQAKAQKTIYYGDLADELSMPNARNLNYVLGSIGQSLNQLGKQHREKIPPIQCLVVNKADDLPGEGVSSFIDKKNYKLMSKRQRRYIVDAQLQKIFGYAKWDWVLKAFSMRPAPIDFSLQVDKAVKYGRGGVESVHHKQLKEYVATHPGLIGLPATASDGTIEYALPSGDQVDVLFRRKNEWIAVEVKSHISSDDDLTRGLFQCVKYQAVLEALVLSKGFESDVRTVLVTTRHLPTDLVPLRNLLRVTVIHANTP